MGRDRIYPELYDKGWLLANQERGLRELAEELGCSAVSVSNGFSLAGIKKPYTLLSPLLRDKAWLTANKERTCQSIADEVGCSASNVWLAYRREGLAHLRTRGRGRPTGTAEQASKRVRVVVKMRRMGMTLDEIAAEFGVTRQAVSYMCQRWDPRIPREEGK